MIIFITDDPSHETDAEIIKTFKINNNDYQLVSPEIPESELTELILKDPNTIVLLKPNHSNIPNICKILMNNKINSINPPQTTLFFRNRWDIINTLKVLFTEEIPQKIEDNFVIPDSWFLLCQSNMSEEEIREFTVNLREKFKGQYPLIVKYPLNHSGFHFVRIINKFEEIISLMKMIETTGIILQEYLRSVHETIKSYCLGEEIITFTQREIVSPLKVGLDWSLEDIIEANLHDLPDNSKNKREIIQTPKEIIELMKYLGKRFEIKIFGIDFIKIPNGKYYIIDFNDFPGCRGLGNAGETIAQYVIGQSQKKQNESPE